MFAYVVSEKKEFSDILDGHILTWELITIFEKHQSFAICGWYFARCSLAQYSWHGSNRKTSRRCLGQCGSEMWDPYHVPVPMPSAPSLGKAAYTTLSRDNSKTSLCLPLFTGHLGLADVSLNSAPLSKQHIMLWSSLTLPRKGVRIQSTSDNQSSKLWKQLRPETKD